MRDGIDSAAFISLAGAGVLLLIAAARLLEQRDVLHWRHNHIRRKG